MIGNIFLLFGIPEPLGEAFFSGLFEITLGASLMAEISTDSILYQAVLVSFILGFNGFSIQAQVASILAKTDIRFYPYFIARMLHGLIASILTWILFGPLYINRDLDPNASVTAFSEYSHQFFQNIIDLLYSGPLLTIVFLLFGMLIMYKKKRDGK